MLWDSTAYLPQRTMKTMEHKRPMTPTMPKGAATMAQLPVDSTMAPAMGAAGMPPKLEPMGSAA